jgi:RNA polymerase sigma-70 factor (sigma-E family)
MLRVAGDLDAPILTKAGGMTAGGMNAGGTDFGGMHAEAGPAPPGGSPVAATVQCATASDTSRRAQGWEADLISDPGGREPSGEFSDYVAFRLPALLRFGYALTGNPHDASDLVQEVLERVGLRWAAIGRGRGGPDAYIRRAMVNARTSRWRRRRPELLVPVIPESAVQQHDRFDDEPLWQALRGLPPGQRAVIVLRYYEDLSEAEIAATLGVSAGTVKSQTARAMATLRQRLSSSDSPSNDSRSKDSRSNDSPSTGGA